MNVSGRYHLVCAVFKTMLSSYCHENCGLFYVNTHLHRQSLFLCVQFSFVAFPSKIILISGFLSPDSNQSSASLLVTVKEKPRINNIRFSAIALFQLYDLYVNKQHEPVSLSSSCIRSNTVGSSFRLLHSFVN